MGCSFAADGGRAIFSHVSSLLPPTCQSGACCLSGHQCPCPKRPSPLQVSLFPLEHSCLTLLPVFPVGSRSLLASLSHPVPSSSDTMSLVCEGPAFSFISEHPLWKAPLQFSEDAYLYTRSTGEEWMEVLWPQGPFILALGSALRCEPGPGHERTASRQPRGSCDE